MAIFNALLNLRELKELYSGKPVCVCPLYNGAINTQKPYEATGNPIVLPEYKSLVKLTTNFSPKQAGTGGPSPENVRPISGYDEVNVNVRGKNLMSDDNFQSSEVNGITFAKMGNGVVRIEGTATATADSITVYDVPQLPPGTYYGISKWLFLVVKKASTGSNMWYTPLSGVSIEVGDVIQYYYFSVPANTPANDSFYIFLAPGESAFSPSEFEPYQTGTTATLTLPETIYGGTVDAVTGEGSKTWGFISSYNGESLPGEWISDRDVYVPGTTPTAGAQVAYKLATPDSFKVSQVTIPSLKGENTFFTNGENMDIIYKKEFFWGDEA